MIFDIHTHNKSSLDGIICVNPAEEYYMESEKLYSVGIHPWTVNETSSSLICKVDELLDRQNVVAVGEIGLDKVCKSPFNLQLEIFEKQLDIARIKNKPVVVHCVRASSEILSFRKKTSTPWIIHRFSGKYELAKQFVDNNCYLSFGHVLLNPSESVASIFKRLLEDKIFLETDDSNTQIDEIILAAAKLRGVSIEQMHNILSANFNKIFKFALQP